MRATAAALLAAATLALGCGAPEAVAPPPGSERAFRGIGGDGPLVVWAIGDGADGRAPARELAARIARDRPDRVLYLGDVYEEGTADEFERKVRGPYRPLLERMLPTPGNHEWHSRDEGYDPFWRSVTGAPTPPWYRVRLGAWEALSLNSEAPHQEGSPQLAWLRERLRRPGTCRIAFWHRPRFSAGKHGEDKDLEPLWDAVAGRAAVVLWGHDHNLQRFHPIRGTVAMVSGAGGRELYDVDGTDPRLAFSDDQTYGGVRLVLRPDSADVAFVALDGRVLDRSRVRCTSS
ncbi:MAG TPA: metallophosphoesterase [Solirubrobacteraceae bacterium]|nr:metallophosphoesterase [Solirubrobacteraceae bacterium]